MPDKVTPADVHHVAGLARLGLDAAAAAALTRDLNGILEHMDSLARVNTDGVPEATASHHGMRLRPDAGPAIPLGEPPSSFVPAMRDGLIQVPRLATHEQAES